MRAPVMSIHDRFKKALAVAALAVVSLWFGPNLVTPAFAQLKGTQTEGTIAPIPIAIPLFLGDDPQLAGDISNVVQADLERSGLFRPLDRASFLEQMSDVNAAAAFPDWRSIQADALVVGRIVNAGDGKVGAEFRLWDVATGKQLAGQRFSTAGQNWRRIGHLIADSVYERLTGEKGYFDTHIVFIDETGPGGASHQAARDHGSGRRQCPPSEPRQGTGADAAVLADEPGNHLHVVHQRPAEGVHHEPRDGQARAGRRLPGMTFAPRFSPDGQKIVMSLGTPDGRSSIYEMDLRIAAVAAPDRSRPASTPARAMRPTAARSCSKAIGTGCSGST